MNKRDQAILILASELLKETSDSYIDLSCNDLYIKDSPENREIVREEMKENDMEDEEIKVNGNGLLYITDFWLMTYCSKQLLRMLKDLE